MKADWQVRNLSLTWAKRAIPGISGPKTKVILDDVSMSFPSGQVSAILVSLFSSARRSC